DQIWPPENQLIYMPKSKEEYGEFPQLGLEKIHVTRMFCSSLCSEN
ncbi:4596_t:CDS:1, partial [Entrophospora sp. SA101]